MDGRNPFRTQETLVVSDDSPAKYQPMASTMASFRGAMSGFRVIHGLRLHWPGDFDSIRASTRPGGADEAIELAGLQKDLSWEALYPPKASNWFPRKTKGEK